MYVNQSIAQTILTPVDTIPTPHITSVGWCADSSKLVIGYSNGVVSVWSIYEGENSELVNIALFSRPDSQVSSVEFGVDGLEIAVGYTDGEIRIWELASGSFIPIGGHTNWIEALVWSHDGSKLASISNQETIIWDIRANEPLIVLPDYIVSLAWGWEDDLIIGDMFIGPTKVWTSSTGELTHELSIDRLLPLLPDSTQIVGKFGNGIEIWDVATGGMVAHYDTGHAAGISSIAWKPDGKEIASGSGILGDDYSVRIIDAITGDEKHVLLGHEAEVVGLYWHPDGEKLLSISLDDTVRLWDSRSGQLVEIFNIELNRFSVSPNREWLATIDSDGALHLWNVSASADNG